MTTLVVENGTGLSNANSYVDVAEADTYFATHPFYADNWDALGSPDQENVLIAASSMLDSIMSWYGYIYSSTQGLGWPRTGVIDYENRVVASNAVPYAVKRATMELAVYISRGDPFAAASSTGVDRLKIDVIEIQFSDTQNGASRVTAPVPAAALLALRGLGEYVLGSRVRRVMVG